ncbi:MAG TPA: DUF6522 family protein [Arenimonas sp.]|nr:DUF6522 family protein [Arenimonas sp.]
MRINWKDHESHALPGVSEALDAAGVDTGAGEAAASVSAAEARPVAVHRRIDVDANLVGQALGLPPQEVPAMVEDGRIATLCERGTGEDAGHFRFTFYYGRRRLRIVTDHQGKVLPRSAMAR